MWPISIGWCKVSSCTASFSGSTGEGPGAFGPVSRTTLPVQQRLTALLERDGRKLDEIRMPTQREIGICRDFALMVCALLRATGTAARLRCGFASYLGGAWEDHWVCEYWNSREDRWCLSDAQLDEVTKAACGVTFDASNVPRNAFLAAGEAWLRCRADHDKPERFGHGDTKGLWFIKVNVVRDAFCGEQSGNNFLGQMARSSTRAAHSVTRRAYGAR